MNNHIENLTAELAEIQSDYELEFTAVALGHPVRAAEAAREVGFDPVMFSQPDLCTMFHACEIAGRRGRQCVLRLCELCLKAELYWDPTQIAGNEGARWSSTSFRAFADSFSQFQSPLCATMSRVYGAKLKLLYEAIRDAREYQKQAIRILDEALKNERFNRQHSRPRQRRTHDACA